MADEDEEERDKEDDAEDETSREEAPGWLAVDDLTLPVPGVVAEGPEVVGADGEGEGDGGEDGEGEQPDETTGDAADGRGEDDPGGRYFQALLSLVQIHQDCAPIG